MSLSNFKVKKLVIYKNDEPYSIIRGLSSLSYFEDVNSPTLIVDLEVLDGDGLLSSLPVLGGEYVDLEIQSTNGLELSFSREKKNPFCVVNCAAIPGTNSQLYGIKLMSYEMLVNETVRVKRRYDSNITSTINSILFQDENLIATNKKYNLETTNNTYSFTGNYKRPFDTIAWLCPKSVPSQESKKNSDTNGTAGFLFFENKNGYNFVSIDKTFLKTPIELTQSMVPLSIYDDNYYRTFSNIIITDTNDLMKSLRMGSYSHNSIFLNFYDFRYKVLTSKLSEKQQSGSVNISRKNSSNFKLNGLEDHPSRLMYRILDPGVMKEDGSQTPIEQLSKYQADAYMRYNLLFTSTTTITLPFNLEFVVGDVVKLKVSNSSRNDVVDKYDATYEDQRYIISKLRHTIQGDNNFTVLELISDSYSISST